MNKDNILYKTYIGILEKELLPAMGCTEPIAVAYCAAKAREVLNEFPDKVLVEVSGNIIKNVKSVVVPNTNGKRGIEAATAIGIIAGKSYKQLEVISDVTTKQKEDLAEYLNKNTITVKSLDSDHSLDILITLEKNGKTASVHIVDNHTNIVEILKNNKVIFHKTSPIDNTDDSKKIYELLNMEDIYDFAISADIGDVKHILDPQIYMNSAIAEEGLRGDYGANIGSILKDSYGNDIKIRAKSKAAAGSDARMNGCELPVVINSGSGNQGLTVSLPIIEYARELKVTEEKLYRALLISNLSAIHLKTAIGRLSAYCGAVSAGASAGAGIAYLSDAGYKGITHTIVNALAITSGIICDGAKASCAAKIVTAVDAGILGFEMYKSGQQFHGGEGIISKGIENTIKNIGLLGQIGMFETDKEIIRIMTCVD